MRTNIVLDDTLMHDARLASGLKTKKETIESALRLLVKVKSQCSIKSFKGRLKWVGDLESMRRD